MTGQQHLFDLEGRKRKAQTTLLIGLGPFELLGEPGPGITFSRTFNCGSYEACLSYAAKLDWRSFTCANCVCAKPGRPTSFSGGNRE